MEKEVSIIIPNYNSAAWLRRTIESCLVQIDWIKQIIVVDDHSTDDSIEQINDLVSEHPEIEIYKSPEKGAAATRNFGFQKATGEYIQWLDADDLLLPGKLKSQLDFLRVNPSIDIVYSDWILRTYDRAGNVVRTEKKMSQNYSDYLSALLKEIWQPSHAYLLKRKVTEKQHNKGGWNVHTKIGQDREYYTLIAIDGGVFGYSPGFGCVYNRWNTDSVSQKMQMETRAIHFAELMESFKKQVIQKTQFDANEMKKYNKIINARILAFNVISKSTSSLISQVQFSEVEWTDINGFRSRVKAFWIWLKARI